MPRAATSQERKLRQFELLARVSSVINSTLDPKEVLNRVIAEAVQAMQATSGSLVFIDPHTQLLQIEVAIGLSKQAQETQLAIGRGVTGWVAKMGKPLRVPDVTADPRYISVRKDIRSELAVPLLVEGTLIGVLNVDSKEHDAFSAEDEELLVAIANQSAQVIQNSWLYQAVAHNARQLESLFSVAHSIISSLNLQEILQQVARDACRLMDSKVCSLMLLNPARDLLELRACHGAGAEYLQKPPLPVDDSVIGFVIRRRKPLRVDNVQEHDEYRHAEMARKEGLVSLLSVPMLVGDAPIGALNVYTAAPYRYSNQDVRTLSALANLAAVAIENARLHEKIVDVEEQLRRNERLSTLGLLAAEVAHEIRNPLTVMKMTFHSLDLKFLPEDPRGRDAEIMSEKMDHLNKIVDHLLGYARFTEPTFDLVDVNDLLDDVLLLTRAKTAPTTDRVGEEVPRRPAQGARRPRPDRAGMPESRPQRCGRDGERRHAHRRHGAAFVSIHSVDVHGHGPGHGSRETERAFRAVPHHESPWHRPGLAIVQKIVEAHRGRIEVKSAPKRGTTFRILLPV